MRVDVEALIFLHCLQEYVVNLSKVQGWEQRELQSSRCAWIPRRGMVCAQAGWHPALVMWSFAVGGRKIDTCRKNDRK